MNNIIQMVDQQRQQGEVLADIQKQAQLVSDMAWSATITKSGTDYQEVMQSLKQQNDKLQQLFNQL